MNRQRFLKLLVFILAISVISGCIYGPEPFDSNTPVGTGVVIEKFGADSPEVYSGEKVTFTLRVRNTGSVKAENGFAELLGLDQVWYEVGGLLNSGGEVLPNEPKCSYINRGITLLPEDPESGITGGTETCTWNYVAPEVLPGLSINSKARARFFYSYRSSTISTVTLVSKEELKNLQDLGRSLPMESYSKTKSPISLDIETRSPIRTYANSVEFPIVITVQNIGGGTVCTNIDACKKSSWDTTNEGWYKMKLSILPPQGMTLDVCSPAETLVLIGDTPQSLSCKIIADTSQQVGILQKNIELRAEYGYFIDKTAGVVVYPSMRP